MRMLNVLLIYPGFADGFRSYSKGRDWINHGISILSSVLRNAGCSTCYLDCRQLGGWNDLTRRISAIDFSLAMISVATVDFDAAQRIAKLIKRKNPDIKIMVGGPHPTLMTQQTAEVPEFDYIFTHEAEITLPQLLQDFPAIPRITRGEMPPDLDRLPFLDRSLAPQGETPWFSGLPQPFFSATASRGCVYNCSFCQPAERYLFGNKVRIRSTDNILEEIQLLATDYNMRSFMIHDDCFTQYPTWVQDFCEKKRKRTLQQPFVCQTRSDIVCRHPDMFRELADVGLRWVLIGFESGSDRILSFIRKGTTVEQNLRAARICKELNIKIFANYMFGLPTETKDEMLQTAEMIQQIAPEMHSPSVFTPAPGSELYSYCLQHDLLLINSSLGYRRDFNSGAKIKGVDYAFIRKLAYEIAHNKPRPVIRSFLSAVGARYLAIRDRLESTFSDVP